MASISPLANFAQPVKQAVRQVSETIGNEIDTEIKDVCQLGENATNTASKAGKSEGKPGFFQAISQFFSSIKKGIYDFLSQFFAKQAGMAETTDIIANTEKEATKDAIQTASQKVETGVDHVQQNVEQPHSKPVNEESAQPVEALAPESMTQETVSPAANPTETIHPEAAAIEKTVAQNETKPITDNIEESAPVAVAQKDSAATQTATPAPKSQGKSKSASSTNGVGWKKKLGLGALALSPAAIYTNPAAKTMAQDIGTNLAHTAQTNWDTYITPYSNQVVDQISGKVSGFSMPDLRIPGLNGNDIPFITVRMSGPGGNPFSQQFSEGLGSIAGTIGQNAQKIGNVVGEYGSSAYAGAKQGVGTGGEILGDALKARREILRPSDEVMVEQSAENMRKIAPVVLPKAEQAMNSFLGKPGAVGEAIQKETTQPQSAKPGNAPSLPTQTAVTQPALNSDSPTSVKPRSSKHTPETQEDEFFDAVESQKA